MTRVLTIEHVDNELDVRENLRVSLNRDFSGSLSNIVGTEDELQCVCVAGLNQRELKVRTELGLHGANLVAAPCPNFLSRTLRSFGNTVFANVPNRHIGGIIGFRIRGWSGSAHRCHKHPTGHGKFRLAYRDIRGVYCHDYSIPARFGHEKTAIRRSEFLNVLRM